MHSIFFPGKDQMPLSADSTGGEALLIEVQPWPCPPLPQWSSLSAPTRTTTNISYNLEHEPVFSLKAMISAHNQRDSGGFIIPQVIHLGRILVSIYSSYIFRYIYIYNVDTSKHHHHSDKPADLKPKCIHFETIIAFPSNLKTVGFVITCMKLLYSSAISSN